MKDTAFFNAQSASYSSKRYPAKPVIFTQYFFKRRLALTLDALAPALAAPDRSVLELGCADGVVAAAIAERFADSIGTFDATDIAPEMIAAAQKQYARSAIRFSVREQSRVEGAYDAIIEVGVLNYTDLEEELEAVAAALAPGGRYVCSIAGDSSIQYVLKGGAGYLHARSYAAYERAFKKHFRIIRTQSVGFFIPYLWKLPALARLVQPIAERILGTVAPGLALEHLYVLEAR